MRDGGADAACERSDRLKDADDVGFVVDRVINILRKARRPADNSWEVHNAMLCCVGAGVRQYINKTKKKKPKTKKEKDNARR